MPPDARVERARELPRRIVAHQEADLVPARLQSGGLELGVLYNRAPERPRERHNDADLHAGSLTGHRSSNVRLAPPTRRACGAAYSVIPGRMRSQAAASSSSSPSSKCER